VNLPTPLVWLASERASYIPARPSSVDGGCIRVCSNRSLRVSHEKEKTEKSRREEIRNQKNNENCAPASKVALKGTVRKSKPLKAELRHIPWSSVESKP